MKLKLNAKFYFTTYFFLLLCFYHVKISTYYYWGYFAYLNDTFFDFNVLRFFISSLIFFINLKFLLQKNKNDLIFGIISFFFILVTIPSLISFISKNLYPVELLFYHQLFFFSMIYFSRSKINFSWIPRVNKVQALYILFGLTTIGIIPYLIAYGPYINLNNLLFKEIYETRALMGQVSSHYFGYTYSIFTKIMIPLFIVFALELKRWYFVIIGVIYMLLFYLFGAHKTIYIGIVLLLVFYKFSYLNIIKFILKYSNVLIILSAILAWFSIDDLWILLFRRVHFLPSLLDMQYLEFFNGMPLYWSDSFLSRFIDYPFDLNHAKSIGRVYYRNDGMNANNGLISDGYMNLGTLGVFINIFIVSFYFMVLNSLNIKSKYIGIYLLVIFSLISSSVFTVMLTHGALGLLIISIFLLNEKES